MKSKIILLSFLSSSLLLAMQSQRSPILPPNLQQEIAIQTNDTKNQGTQTDTTDQNFATQTERLLPTKQWLTKNPQCKMLNLKQSPTVIHLALDNPETTEPKQTAFIYNLLVFLGFIDQPSASTNPQIPPDEIV